MHLPALPSVVGVASAEVGICITELVDGLPISSAITDTGGGTDAS